MHTDTHACCTHTSFSSFAFIRIVLVGLCSTFFVHTNTVGTTYAFRIRFGLVPSISSAYKSLSKQSSVKCAECMQLVFFTEGFSRHNLAGHFCNQLYPHLLAHRGSCCSTLLYKTFHHNLFLHVQALVHCIFVPGTLCHYHRTLSRK